MSDEEIFSPVSLLMNVKNPSPRSVDGFSVQPSIVSGAYFGLTTGDVGGVPSVACVGGDDSGVGVPLEDVAKSFIRTLPLSAPPTSEVLADGHMWSGSPCAASGMEPRDAVVAPSEGNVVPLREVEVRRGACDSALGETAAVCGPSRDVTASLAESLGQR